MDRAQLRRRAHVGLTLIADDLVGKPKLFQQPQHALGAGIIEMMDSKHGDSPGTWRFCVRLVVPAGRWKVEMRRRALYYPDVIDRIIYPGNICAGNQEFCNESGV